LDEVAQQAFKAHNPGAQPPDPKMGSQALYGPLLAEVLQIFKKYTPTQAQANALQSTQELLDKLNKREKLLQNSGIEFAPTKSSSSSPGLPLQLPQEQSQQRVQDTPEVHSDQLDVLAENLIEKEARRLSGHSEEDVKAWLLTFKRSKNKQFEEWQDQINNSAKNLTQKYTIKDLKNLRKVAFKIGIPYTIASKLGLRSLAKVLAVALSK
jgi:hypothetical protein